MKTFPDIPIRPMVPGEVRYFDLHGAFIIEVPFAQIESGYAHMREMRYLRVEVEYRQRLVYRPPAPCYMRSIQQIADLQNWLEYTIYRNGIAYDFSGDIKQEAQVTFNQQTSNNLEIWDYYECASLHDGPAIGVYVVNPRWDSDDESPSIIWDRMCWAENGDPVEDLIHDAYADAIREDLVHVSY